MKTTVIFAHVQFEFFFFTLLFCAYFCNEIERCQLLTGLSILRQMNNDVRSEYVPWKMSDLVSFTLSHEKISDFVTLPLFNSLK